MACRTNGVVVNVTIFSRRLGDGEGEREREKKREKSAKGDSTAIGCFLSTFKRQNSC